MNHNNRHIFVRFVAVWLVSIAMMLVLGLITGKYLSKTQAEVLADRPSAVRNSGYAYINPLLECELSEDTIRRSLRSFKGEINKEAIVLLQMYKLDALSIYFRDLNNGVWFGIDEFETFSPASLLKVPLLMAILRETEKNPGVMDEQVENTLDQNFDLRESVASGVNLEPRAMYTVKQLLDFMIINSSNNAAVLLANRMSTADITRLYRDLGVPELYGSVDEYAITVKQYASFFRVLFNASYLSRDASEKALQYLSVTEFQDGLVAGVPKGIPVSHKFGERLFNTTAVRQLHDCGIIYYPNHPYLLCVMTKGRNEEELVQSIARISAVVYNEVDAQFLH